MKSAGSWRSSLNDRRGVSRPGARPTAGTVELIAVGPSIGSCVRLAASGKKNWLKLRSQKSQQSQFNPLRERARVIQIAQKIASREKVLASDLAAILAGRSIPRLLTRNSVALYAIKHCARRPLASNGTTSRWGMWVRSLQVTVCVCSWPDLDRVPSLGLLSE